MGEALSWTGDEPDPYRFAVARCFYCGATGVPGHEDEWCQPWCHCPTCKPEREQED